MDGEPHVPKRRPAGGSGTAATALLLIGAAACGVPTPEGPPARIVIAMSAASTERQPGTTGAIRDLVRQAAARDAAVLDIVVDRPDGPETVATIDLVPRRGPAVERSADRRDLLLGGTLDDVGARMSGAAADSGRIDVLGLLAQVARVPGPATAVVVTSGLQSVGSLAVETIGWDLVGSDAVLERAVAEGLLPDLTGKTVVFSGLGDVVAPQERLPERLRARLATMWLGVCERAGAQSCRVDTEPAPGAPTVSTVPVPTVSVPPDPVLAVPTADAVAPAVTELPSDVLFEPDSAWLLPDAVELLRSVAGRVPPGATIDLTGRTATVGSPESSRAFSLERADSCRDVLVEAGVPVDRIVVSGLGHDRPLVPDVDPAGRLIPDAARRNRTVTLTITPAAVAPAATAVGGAP